MVFLFWNIRRKSLSQLVAAAAHQYGVDVIILAESKLKWNELGPLLNPGGAALYLPENSFGVEGKEIAIVSRLPANSVVPLGDPVGMSFRQIHPPLGPDVLLGVVHLPSKLYQSDDDLAMQATVFGKQIGTYEQRLGHKRTIMIGDFNMNPFEHGMVAASGLNAVMSRRVAARGTRTVLETEHDLFYNPMWSQFGDHGNTPAGTYYYSASKQICYFWNVFDQVLIRPSLLDRFSDDGVQVLSKIGEQSLLTANNIPDIANASDHLPVIFTIDLERE